MHTCKQWSSVEAMRGMRYGFLMEVCVLTTLVSPIRGNFVKTHNRRPPTTLQGYDTHVKRYIVGQDVSEIRFNPHRTPRKHTHFHQEPILHPSCFSNCVSLNKIMFTYKMLIVDTYWKLRLVIHSTFHSTCTLNVCLISVFVN